jgi:hypothetical protein
MYDHHVPASGKSGLPATGIAGGWCPGIRHKQVADVFSDGQSALAGRPMKWKSWLNVQVP